ncbi:TetR/AcrR family transcriptional regulator [Planobispora takensis]|uniref:Putative transcriptional regulator, TetR family protein n=1 Tax=Planobispora takensis TaxID=1367882 RepID=A0A8J3T405_9ACTN|nr:TetR/AcrR family transcriptional regulator [Planobispora takensis]GII05293.1 putative transcriptional regulator, TetR family protein [Planobispora takensis]
MTKRGPYRKGEAKRLEILQVALQIFAEEGYRGTSLRKVAARCGLSLPGIMHYFESKEDLLIQVLRMRDDVERERRAEYRGLEDALATLGEGMRTPGLVELFVSMAATAGDASHPAHDFFPSRYATLREAVTRRVQEAMDAGRITSAVPADRVAVLLLAVADGIQLQWLSDRSIDMREPMADVLGLLRPSPGEHVDT